VLLPAQGSDLGAAIGKQRAASIPADRKVRLREGIERLVQLYDGWGKKDKADRWRKQLEETSAAVKPPNESK
jgi:hypothetical protein